MITLGEGIGGKVYTVGNDSKTAIKRLFKDETTEGISNVKELVIMNMIKHPYIVAFKKISTTKHFEFSPVKRTQEYSTKDDILHFTMEKGTSDLSSFVRDHSISPLLASKLMYQMLSSVDYIHNLNIIHRDIKADNFLIFEDEVDKDGEVGVIKLCDFGHSTFYHKMHVGTQDMSAPFYRAPEVIVDGKYNLTIDTWSLGVCFYWMMIESFPFNAEEPRENLNQMESLENWLSPIERSNERREKDFNRFLSDVKANRHVTIDIVNCKKWEGFTETLRQRNDNWEDDYAVDYLKDVLQSMLVLKPANRVGIYSIMKMPFFEEMHQKLKTKRTLERQNIFSSGTDDFREHLGFMITRLRRGGNAWMTPRVAFKALQILNEYVEKEKEETGQVVFTALYMALKYEHVLKLPPSFSSLNIKLGTLSVSFDNYGEFELKVFNNVVDTIGYANPYEYLTNHPRTIEPYAFFSWCLIGKNTDDRQNNKILDSYETST